MLSVGGSGRAWKTLLRRSAPALPVMSPPPGSRSSCSTSCSWWPGWSIINRNSAPRSPFLMRSWTLRSRCARQDWRRGARGGGVGNPRGPGWEEARAQRALNSHMGAWDSGGWHRPGSPSRPTPAGWRRGLQEVTPGWRETRDVDFSLRQAAHCRGSGQVSCSAGMMGGPAGLGPNRVLKPQVALCTPWLSQGTGQGNGACARVCTGVCVCVAGGRGWNMDEPLLEESKE